VRIVYFYQYFTTPKGAWSTRAYEFARRWVAAGDKVTVVTSVYDKSDLRARGLISHQCIEGIDVVVIGVPLSNRHGFLLRLWTFAAYAIVSCWYALTLPADVVISSSGPITTALPGLVARYLRRIPWVFEVRDLWPDGAIELGILRNGSMISVSRFLERICYNAAHCIVALSDGMARLIHLRVPGSNVAVVPNAADNELIDAIQSDELLPEWARGKKLVTYAGTLGVANSCEQILEMAGHLQSWQESQIEVILIGDGKQRAHLEARALELELGNVHFLGLLPRNSALSWLKMSYCSLLVLRDTPLIATGSPNKLFDALAAGAPVVQNTQDWMKSLLEKEQCGLTVPAGNSEELARAVQRLARNETQRNELSVNALRVAREIFDRELLAEKMHRVLHETAALA
jgi:glycosyltransferase involved in cell wall biosynthesis